MEFTKKLKIILQSKKLIFFLSLISIIYFTIYLLFPKTSKLNQNQKVFTGKIIEYSWKTEQIVKLKIQLQKEKIIAEYEMPPESNFKQEIMTGMYLEMIGDLEVPLTNTIPNTFSYRNYLKTENIFYCLKIKKLKIIKKGSWWNQIQTKLRWYCDQSPNAHYLKKLILGIQEDNSDLMRIYRRNGISHVFVISGMHLSMIYNFLNSKIKKKKKKRYLISFLGLSLYYSMLPYSISSQRAYIFLGLETIKKELQLNWSKSKIFFINLWINILRNPLSVFQIGFQYSFLIAFAYIILEKKEKNKIKAVWKNGMFIFLFSLPITIYHNFQINPWSILNNMVLIPIVISIIFPLLILNLFCPFLGNSIQKIITLFENLNSCLYKLPLSSIVIPKTSWIWILCYYVLLISYIYYKKRILIFWISVLIIANLCYQKLNSNAYIYFLDVGQGDCMLIVTPYQKDVILIDTGYESKIRKENILSFLRSIGISKIDTMILTHGDADHMGQAIYLMEDLSVHQVIFNDNEYNKLEQNLIKELEKKQIAYRKGIEYLDIKPYKLQFLSTKKYSNENDNSNVIYLYYKGYKFLLMGDAGVEKEKDILAKYKLKEIDFLKVGHHGSDTSSSQEFIDVLAPKYSIFSVGKENRYHHPSKVILNRLSKSKIYRTDRNGSIEIKINKNGFNIKNYAP